MRSFIYRNDATYDLYNLKRPFPILNETIDKRYRDNGYEVVYAIYPDKKIFGVDVKNGDKVILIIKEKKKKILLLSILMNYI